MSFVLNQIFLISILTVLYTLLKFLVGKVRKRQMKPMPRQKVSTELVHTITVRTCVGIYDELKVTRPEFFGNAPSEGVDVTVDYADTWQEGKQFDKVIVAVHGAPGKYNHFYQLIEYYRNTNVRVIAPNLPDFSHTRETKSFWHTTKEKTMFIKDFLAKLDINEIDCLISHSFGFQTIAGFWENPGDVHIRAVALFSPQPYWDLKEKEKQRIRSFFKYRSEAWFNFLSFTKFHKIPFTPLKLKNINEFLTLCATAVDDKTSVEIVRRIELLNKSKRPVVLLYGQKESLISQAAINRLHDELQIDLDDIVQIDPNVDSPDKVTMKNLINSYLIQNAGHFAHANYSVFSNKMIDNLLSFTGPTNSNT